MSASGKDEKNMAKDIKLSTIAPKQNLVKPVESNERILNVWIKDLKNCYSDWKSSVCSICENQQMKEIQQKRKEFANQFCHPLANLYRQLPLELTNYKFGLIQQYPQKNRLFFLQSITLLTAIKTISSRNIVGANKLLFSFRNSGLIFLLGGLFVVPEIYNPWIKSDC